MVAFLRWLPTRRSRVENENKSKDPSDHSQKLCRRCPSPSGGSGREKRRRDGAPGKASGKRCEGWARSFCFWEWAFFDFFFGALSSGRGAVVCSAPCGG